MSGGEALDLALGLLRAPARRGLLAGRSLPTGMTTLLEVAGGSSTAARAAAAATGAAPEELLEAARFFVQQVLFTEDASAYRILGVQPDAPQSRLHTHHRLLQRWLHPDRDGGLAWDSAYSARVNGAWSRVRTPHARRAYDQEQAAARRAPAGRGHAPNALRPPPAGRGYAADAHRPSATPRIAGLLAIVAVIVLSIAIARQLHQRDLHAQAEPFPADPVPTATPADAATPGDDPVAPLADAATRHALAARPQPEAHPPAAPDPGPTLQPAPAATEPIAHAPAQAPAGQTAHVAHAANAADAANAAAPPIPAETTAVAPVTPPEAVAVAHPAVPEAATAATPAPPEAAAADPLQLLQQAEQTVSQATAYLASDGSRIPPIWHDFPTEAAAGDARAHLHLRQGGATPGTLALDGPQWRLGDERAVLEAGYRTGPGEHGRFRIELARTDQRWLVTRLQLEPAP